MNQIKLACKCFIEGNKPLGGIMGIGRKTFNYEASGAPEYNNLCNQLNWFGKIVLNLLYIPDKFIKFISRDI